mmetsp:Transcript_63210/g.150750  ORF Transcript_63210/g.150750 Transcript_63210/m.150750 type:complete len:101 (+) Transcript_63210:1416-1718(+)
MATREGLGKEDPVAFAFRPPDLEMASATEEMPTQAARCPHCVLLPWKQLFGKGLGCQLAAVGTVERALASTADTAGSTTASIGNPAERSTNAAPAANIAT